MCFTPVTPTSTWTQPSVALPPPHTGVPHRLPPLPHSHTTHTALCDVIHASQILHSKARSAAHIATTCGGCRARSRACRYCCVTTGLVCRADTRPPPPPCHTASRVSGGSTPRARALCWVPWHVCAPETVLASSARRAASMCGSFAVARCPCAVFRSTYRSPSAPHRVPNGP